MKFAAGNVAVVTGAASGIGRALAHRFAADGLDIVLADVDEVGMTETAATIKTRTLVVKTDVSKVDSVDAMAAAALDFGNVKVVCNNAGVGGGSDPWFGPLSVWDWTLGVNLMGVVYGVRAFLPHLLGSGGYIINTASIAGLFPGAAAPYDASKHAVVAITEDLYRTLQTIGPHVGVSCLCPGWVNTGIGQAERNWPAELGELPEQTVAGAVMSRHLNRALAEGLAPAAVADLVAAAVEADQFWVFPHPDWMEMVSDRWNTIREGSNPSSASDIPGMAPTEQIIAEVIEAMAKAKS